MGGKKLLGLIVMAAAVVGTSSVAMAGKSGGGKSAPVSTIALSQAETARVVGTLSFGQNVTFTSTVEQLSGGEYPMVYVECYSVLDGTLLYGMLDHADATFLLGGSWSPWWDIKSDGDCWADLMAYGGRKGPRTLAESEHFYVVGW